MATILGIFFQYFGRGYGFLKVGRFFFQFTASSDKFQCLIVAGKRNVEDVCGAKW